MTNIQKPHCSIRFLKLLHRWYFYHPHFPFVINEEIPHSLVHIRFRKKKIGKTFSWEWKYRPKNLFIPHLRKFMSRWVCFSQRIVLYFRKRGGLVLSTTRILNRSLKLPSLQNLPAIKCRTLVLGYRQDRWKPLLTLVTDPPTPPHFPKRPLRCNIPNTHKLEGRAHF